MNASDQLPSNDNSVHPVHSDDLPKYGTIVKDLSTKDSIPPSYNFVVTHSNDFGIEAYTPSALPQYHSKRNSFAVVNSSVPVES